MNLYEFYSSNKKVNITENLIHAKDVENEVITENLRKWFKEKWVRFGPDGKIRGDCARGSESEGKPKCLPRSKAQSLGKKGRASAARKKRREDPNPERRGSAINVSTKVKEDQDFTFTPEQEKWLGNANRKDPYILARMPGPKPPPSYFSDPQDQQTAQNIQRSQDLATKWQNFRQSNSLSNKIINKLPGVNQVASAVDVGSKLVQGDLSGAGRQAIGMIPGAKNLNTALQVGDVARNLSSGNTKDAGMGALNIAAGQGNKDASNVLKGVKNIQRVQKVANMFENKARVMGTDSAAQAQRNKLSAASVGAAPAPTTQPQTTTSGPQIQSPVQQVDPGAAARAAARRAAATRVATSPTAPAATTSSTSSPSSSTLGKITNVPRPGTPSIYAPPEEWARYRAAQSGDTTQSSVQTTPVAPATTSIQRNQFDTRRGSMPRAGTGQYYQPEPTDRDLDRQPETPGQQANLGIIDQGLSRLAGNLTKRDGKWYHPGGAQVTNQELIRKAEASIARPPGTTASGTVKPAPTTGVSTDTPSALSGGGADNDRTSSPAMGDLPLPSLPSGPSTSTPARPSQSAVDMGTTPSFTQRPETPKINQQMSQTQRDAEDQSQSRLSISEPVIPNSMTIERGDTLSTIARQNGVTVAELMRLNPQIKDPNKIFVGATLNLPPFAGSTATPATEVEPKRRAQSAPTSADEPAGDVEPKRPAQSAPNNSQASQEPGISISPDDMSPDTRQTSTGRKAPLGATAPTLPTGRDISDDVLGNFTRQNRNIKIDKDTLANAMSLGLVDKNGVPDKEAIKKWQEENGFKGRDIDGLLGKNTGDKINQIISQRDQGPAARVPTSTPAAPPPTNQQQELRSNLTPEQRAHVGNADLSRPETGSTGVIQRMPLPPTDEMADAIGKAETQKNPDLAFGDEVRNGQIVSIVKGNIKNSPGFGKPLLTAEQWSKQNLGDAKKLSDMTVDEVMRFQKYRSENHSNANAVGAYQFVGSTLENIAKKSGIDPKTTKFDQATQNRLLQELTKENANVLKSNGIVPDKVNLYMAHAVGGRGAVDIYDGVRNDPNKAVIDTLMDAWKSRNKNDAKDPAKVEARRRQLLAGNPHFRDMKVGEYYNYLSGATRGDRRNTDYYRRTKTSQVREEACPHCSGPMFNIDMLTEKKDACYYKVKSRYKVWPSAYASGALVKCRKRGASNWGKSKTNENLYFNVVGTDKKTLITEFNMRRDVRGWYLTGDSASSEKLDAFRAFGAPLTEEELNPTAYSGSAATINVDNPISPVGSLSKSQRINKKSRSK